MTFLTIEDYELRSDDMAECPRCECCGEYLDEFGMCPNGCDFAGEGYTVFPTNLGDIPCLFDDNVDEDDENETDLVEFEKDGYVPTVEDLAEMGQYFSELDEDWADEQDRAALVASGEFEWEPAY